MSPCILVRNSRKPSSDHRGRASELRILSCGLCGRSFECHGPPSCWCRGIKLTRVQLKEITELASDCICPTCLQERAHRGCGTVKIGRLWLGWGIACKIRGVHSECTQKIWANPS